MQVMTPTMFKITMVFPTNDTNPDTVNINRRNTLEYILSTNTAFIAELVALVALDIFVDKGRAVVSIVSCNLCFLVL
ncbi:hypothetical protein AC249_AIPGENE27673 [Exaiptasia diaphana]|nr:hypothetical protein AC249_AIPGENE27673 [Exaiptasia diaphana]